MVVCCLTYRVELTTNVRLIQSEFYGSQSTIVRFRQNAETEIS